MTIEEVRNRIRKAEDEISEILTGLYDDTNIDPQRIYTSKQPRPGVDVWRLSDIKESDYHVVAKIHAVL
jgi:DNA-directed RNA polymerase delta subunit